MTSPLTPEAVAQMVADREAGTPGPWSLFDHAKGKIMAVCIGAKANGSRPCIIDSGGFDSTDLPTKQNRANASRIARLPDLEAAYLTLAAENATLRHDLDMKEIACDMLNTAWDQSIATIATLRADNENLMNNTQIHISDDVAEAIICEGIETVKALRASEAAALERVAELLTIIDRGRQDHLSVDDCLDIEYARSLTPTADKE